MKNFDNCIKAGKFALASFILIFTNISCRIGLGEAVDTEPPAIEIIAPEADFITRSTFRMSGTCSDDGTLSKIEISLKNTTDKTVYAVQEAEIAEDQKSWNCTFSPYNSDGSKKIPDGPYEATVKILDTFGHMTTAYRSFSIDNTPPILVLTRPSSLFDSESFDTYGQTFGITGQSSDISKIDCVELCIYSDKEMTNLLETIPLANVPPTVDMTAAQYGAENGYYETLYGTEKTAGTKNFYYQVKVYDKARKVPAETGDKGNCAEYYFMYDDIYASVLSKFKLTDVYSILAGNYKSTGEETEAVADVLKIIGDETVGARNAAGEKINARQTKGKFALNPMNNPTFSITGYEALKKDGDGNFDFKESSHQIVNGSKITVKVTSGLDNIPLINDTLGLNAYKCDDKGNKTDGNPIVLLPVLRDKDGNQVLSDEKQIAERKGKISEVGSYGRNIVVQLDKSFGFEIGHNYLIEAVGYDENKNEINNNGTYFGFVFSSKGIPSKLSVQYFLDDETTQNTETTKYLSKNKSITVKGTATHEESSAEEKVYASVVIVDPSETDAATKEPKVVKTVLDDQKITSADGSFEVTIPGTEFGDVTKSYQIKVIARFIDVKTSEKTSVLFDVEAPEVKISDSGVSPLVSRDGKKNVNGKFSITGTITDSYEVSSASYKIYAEGYENNPIKAGTSLSLPVFSISDIDTTKKSEFDNKTLVIAIDAKDKAGNIRNYTNKNYFINQDTDKPVITINEKKSSTDSKFHLAKNSFFTGNASDDDRVKSITVTLYPIGAGEEKDTVTKIYDNAGEEVKPAVTIADSEDTNPTFSFKIPDMTGDYIIEIVAEDVTGVKKIEEGKIYISGNAPKINLDNRGEVRYVSDITGFVLSGTIAGESDPAHGKPLKLFMEQKKSALDTDEPERIPVWTDTSGKNANQPFETTGKFGTDIVLRKDCNLTNEAGKYEFKLVAVDSNEIENYLVVNYREDKNAPTVSITNPKEETGGVLLASDSVPLSGTASDADSKVLSVYYALESEPAVPSGYDRLVEEKWTGWTPFTGTGNWSQTLEEVTEGNHTVYVCAVDKAGNVSTVVSRDFRVDVANPEITTKINSNVVNDAATLTLSENMNFEFTVFDSYKLDETTPVSVSVKKGNTSLVKDAGYKIESVGSDTAQKKVRKLTLLLAESDLDGNYEIKIDAKDGMGKTSSVTRNIAYDKSAPKLTVANKTSYVDWQRSNTITIKGTATDTSGVHKIWYTRGNGALPADTLTDSVWTSAGWHAASGSTSWEFVLDILDGDENADGHTIKIAAVDTNGVAAVCETLSLKVDGSIPVLAVNNEADIPEFMPSAGFDLEVSAEDGFKLSEAEAIVISETFNGVSSITKKITVDSGISSINKTIKLPLGDGDSRGTVNTGKYEYSIKVKDAGGNVSTEWNKSITVDLEPPVSIIETPSTDTESKGNNAVNTRTFRFDGKTTDVGSAPVKLYWQIVAGKKNEVSQDEAKWNVIDGTVNSWSIDQEFVEGDTQNPAEGKLKEGTYTLFVKCEDKAKNQSSVVAREFDVDLSDPLVTLGIKTNDGIALESGEDKSINDKGFKFVYSASDTAGLASANPVITVTKDDISLASTAYTDTNGVIAFTNAADGVYKVHIKATDIFGKSTEKEAQIRLDTKGPVIIVDSPKLSDWQTKGSFQIKGSNEDITGIKEMWWATDPINAAGGEYKLEEIKAANGWKKFSGKLTNWRIDYELSAGSSYLDGKIYFAAVDNTGNLTVQKNDLKIDTAAPVIGATMFIGKPKDVELKDKGKSYVRKPTAEEKKAGTPDEYITLSGVLTDNYKIDDFILKAEKGERKLEIHFNSGKNADGSMTRLNYKINGESNTPGVNPPAISDRKLWNWSINVPFAMFDDGEWKISYEVIDSSGQKATQTSYIHVDVTAPEAGSIVKPASEELNGWYVKTAVNYELNWSDGDSGSGIDKVEYSIDDGTSWVTMAQADTKFTGIINFNIDENKQGTNAVKFRATDKAGNITPLDSAIKFDTLPPEEVVLAKKKTDKTYSQEGFNSETELLVDSTIRTLQVNNSKALVVYLDAKDDGEDGKQSGLESVKITKIGNSSGDPIVADLVSKAENPYNGFYKATIPTTKLTGNGGQVVAEAVDKVGNKKTSNLFQLEIDNNAPTVSINNIADADSSTSAIIDVNGTITLSGIASDNRRVTRVVIEAKSEDAAAFSTVETLEDTENGISNWTYDLDTTSYTDEKKLFIRATAYDHVGNSTTSSVKEVYVNQATDIPVITLNNIALTGMSALTAEKAVWFQQRTIYGTVTDDDGLLQNNGKSYVNVTYTKVTEDASELLGYKKTDVTETANLEVSGSSFEFSFKDEVGSSLSDGMYLLEFSVTDGSGSVFATGMPDGAKPIVQDSTAMVSKITKSTGVILKLDTVPPEIGTVSITTDVNTDGTLKENPRWTNRELSKILLGGTEVPKFAAKFEVTDNNGIKALDGEKPGVVVQLSGAASHDVPASDVSKDPETNEYIIKNLPATGGTGRLLFGITARDNAGTEREAQEILYIDNTAPTIEFVGTDSVINYNGGATEEVQYRISESGADLYMAVTGSESNSPDDWVPVSSGAETSMSGKLIFDGDIGAKSHFKKLYKYLIDLEKTTSTGIKATEDTIADKTFNEVSTICLWVKVVDSLGNENATTRLTMRIDPLGDFPTLTIISPEKDSQQTDDGLIPRVGGKPKISGTVNDPAGTILGIDSVWVQIISEQQSSSKLAYSAYDTVSTFNFEKAEIDFLAEQGYQIFNMKKYTASSTAWTIGSDKASGESYADYAIKAVLNGTSWSLRLNDNGEFNKAGDINAIAVRVFAKDMDGNISLPETLVMKFDANRPVIGDAVPLFLVQSDSAAFDANENYSVSVQYKENMFIKAPETGKNWYLIGSAQDDTINELIVGSTKLIDSGSVTVNDSSVTKTTSSGNDIVKFKYPVTLTGDVGEVSLTITASDGNNDVSQDLVFKYDKKAPVLGNNSGISTEVKQSNYFYNMNATVTEAPVNNVSQSGLDKVAVYFKRASSINKVYNPLLSYTNDNRGVSVAGVISKAAITASTTDGTIVSDSSLYWIYKKVSDIDQSAVTLESLAAGTKDDNIHPNSLVQMGGSIYTIDSMSGSVINLDSNPASNLTYALVALASVVDNTREESPTGAIQADGYYERLTSDDGDRMQEFVQLTGEGEYKWDAYICSRNIPDGPIEIHYVAFDKAGNYTTGSVTGAKVSNNSPRIAKVRLGTDLNGNGKLTKTVSSKEVEDSEEWFEPYNVRDIESGLTTNVEAADWNGQYDEKDVLGKLKDKVEIGEASKPYMTLKGLTQLQLEIVGGNGQLGLLYEIPGYTNGATDASKDLKNSEHKTLGMQSGSVDYSAKTNVITLQAGDLAKAGDRTNSAFTFKIYDNTEGMEPYTNDNAEVILHMGIAMSDTTPPTAVIHPFYWNSLSENSVGGSGADVAKKELLGHIELEKDLPSSRFTSGGEGIYDLDPKVSGQIVITGGASDNKLLQYIYLKVPGMETLFGSEGLTQHSTKAGFYRMATYENGSWTGSNGTGFSFEVTDSKFVAGKENPDDDGHFVEWKFTWDTSKISDVVKANVAVEVLAEDYGSPTYNEGAGYSAKGFLSIDGTTYYDDVSYAAATQVSSLSTTQTAKWNAGFTARGDETPYYKMDVVGYVTEVVTSLSTMKSNNPSVYNRSSLGHYPVQSVVKNVANGKLSNTTSETVTLRGFNLTKTPAVTGGTSVAVSGSDVTFNVSDLPSGSALITINNIPVINNLNNNDAKGDATTDGTNKANWYNRQANGDNNNNLNDDIIFDVWEINDKVAVPQAGLMGGLRMAINPTNKKIQYAFTNGNRGFSMGNGTYSHTRFITGHDDYYSPSSVGFHIGVNNNTATTFATVHGGADTDYYYLRMNGSTTNQKNLQEIKGTGDGIKDRMQATSIASTANGLYLAAFDKKAGTVRFWSGDYSNNPSLTGRTVIAANGSGGQYVSIAATANDEVCAVWYNLAENKVQYAYTENPKDATVEWKGKKDIFTGGGKDCQIAIDANGGIHVAAAVSGKLEYAYAPAYNKTFTTTVVDINDVGEHLTLDVALVNGKPVPYMGYYSGWQRPKYAKLVDTSWAPENSTAQSAQPVSGVDTSETEFSGKWDISVVPVRDTLVLNEEDKINLGIWKTTAGVLTTSRTTAATQPNSTWDITNDNGTANTWGNGTANGVLMYLTDGGAAMESAQLR